MNAEENKQTSKQAVVYVRVAWAGKDTDGLRDRQRQDCLELCARMGLEASGNMFEDSDIPARPGHRLPGFESLLEHVRQQESAWVVTWHIDRLCRHPGGLERLIDLGETRPVRVETVAGGGFDLSTPGRRQAARLMIAAASFGDTDSTPYLISSRAPRRVRGGDRHAR